MDSSRSGGSVFVTSSILFSPQLGHIIPNSMFRPENMTTPQSILAYCWRTRYSLTIYQGAVRGLMVRLANRLVVGIGYSIKLNYCACRSVVVSFSFRYHSLSLAPTASVVLASEG